MLRLSISSLFLAPFLIFSGRKVPRDPKVWRYACISAVLGIAIPMNTFILSLKYLSSGLASIFVTVSPAILVVAAHLFLPDERLTRNKVLGVALAFAGSLFLVLRGESGLAGVGRANPIGFLLVVTGVLSESANAIIVRKRMQEMDVMTITGIRLFVGALILLVLTTILGDFSLEQVTTMGYVSLGFAALIGALAGQFMAFYIMRTHGATAFSLTSYMTPVVATTLGVVLLDEIVTWAMLIGVILIGSGITLVNRIPKVVGGGV